MSEPIAVERGAEPSGPSSALPGRDSHVAVDPVAAIRLPPATFCCAFAAEAPVISRVGGRQRARPADGSKVQLGLSTALTRPKSIVSTLLGIPWVLWAIEGGRQCHLLMTDDIEEVVVRYQAR